VSEEVISVVKWVNRTKVAGMYCYYGKTEFGSGDNEPGRYATFLEAIALEIESKYRQIEELDCQGEWCGKSPNKHDDGLCGVCKMQKELFVDKLG